MCTAFNYNNGEGYFGRNLDIDRSFSEEIVMLPRRYPLKFRMKREIKEHYAIIGMASVIDGIPLLYDGANEYGLAMAGLNFPENAYYESPCFEKSDNIAPFELIVWILCQCKNVADARRLLERLRLVGIDFSPNVKNSPLHFIVSDKKASLTVEPMKDGLKIYDNPVGVLTNNPPFPYQLENLRKYEHLRTDNDGIAKEEKGYSDYCQGLGGVGLPGDLSSKSRFVRAAFGLENSVCDKEESASVSQVFHLLSFVEMVKGLCVTDEGTLDHTVYSACINTDKGRYYYTTYENRQISFVDMHDTDLDGNIFSRFPLHKEESFSKQKQS